MWRRLCLVVCAAACGTTEEPERDPVLVRVELTGSPTNGWVAYQDGDRPWQLMPEPTSEGHFELSIRSATYAVAWVLEEPYTQIGRSNRIVTVRYEATDETPVVSDTVSSAEPEILPVESSTSCGEDETAVTTWELTQGLGYLWTLNNRIDCGGTHAYCNNWFVAKVSPFYGARMSERKYTQPPLWRLGAWPYGTQVRCGDESSVNVSEL